MKEKVGKIIDGILITILSIIAVIIVIMFIKIKANPSKIPSIFSYKPFIVLSGSMETELYKGDLALVKEIECDKLKINDIIAFRDDENYVVTHRIVNIVTKDGNKQFITKGDNNNIKDDWYVDSSKIEGIYVKKIAGLGNVLIYMQKPTTLIITLGIILVAGILFAIIDNDSLNKKERAELEEYRKKSQNT